MAELFPPVPKPPLTIAVSECLLGARVRYDGTDSRSAFPHDELMGLFTYRGLCPEVGIGLGVPRPPIRLERKDGVLRAVGIDDPGVDVTDRLSVFARQKAGEFGDVSGYVFKNKSPSCGLSGVKISPESSLGSGRGIYAQTILEHCPNLPVEEGDRLHDPLVRELFVARVFAYAHWRALLRVGLTEARLSKFVDHYESLLQTHSIEHDRRASVLLRSAYGDMHQLADKYLTLLMAGLGCPVSR